MGGCPCVCVSPPPPLPLSPGRSFPPAPLPPAAEGGRDGGVRGVPPGGACGKGAGGRKHLRTGAASPGTREGQKCRLPALHPSPNFQGLGWAERKRRISAGTSRRERTAKEPGQESEGGGQRHPQEKSPSPQPLPQDAGPAAAAAAAAGAAPRRTGPETLRPHGKAAPTRGDGRRRRGGGPGPTRGAPDAGSVCPPAGRRVWGGLLPTVESAWGGMAPLVSSTGGSGCPPPRAAGQGPAPCYRLGFFGFYFILAERA